MGDFELKGVAAEAYTQAEVSSAERPTALSADDMVSVFVEAAKMRDEAKAREKEASRLMADLMDPIVAHFQDEGIQRVTKRGRTVSIRREVWPKVVDDDLRAMLPEDATKEERDAVAEAARTRLIEALKDDPQTRALTKFTYASPSLRSFILSLEHDDEGMPIMPEHLDGKLSVSETFKVVATRS